MDDAKQLLGGFTQLAQSLAAAPGEDARLKVAVDSAVDLVARCDHAGMTINQNGRLVTRASTGDLVQRANVLQTELGEGPCLDVRRDQNTLVSTSLAVERRWALWAPRVHEELKVDSMMSLLVYTDETSFGALSLYCRDGCRFDADDVAVAQALAGHLSVVMAAEKQIDQLGLALHNRNIIGQAQGVLMERFDMTADQAFDYLRRISSNSNRKVAVVAAEIARTRRLPEVR
ncbi:GAF and ANTAR domain-containing protein [Pimelobacter simplex]|uniref:GAF and ANTAR domain-containing protein n=1 Tax=Nocardioides simplex TaxID=2045 RepID=UPI00214FE5B7|nr:GAF and ANTAR domain-containing protein [Pimelobacter simplex]UUW91019.1 GAF and ANTAR domain-containing protein [Pimelobacter simplex]UUW94847.1 GAF and ANTAR domain-containing protein [Pimelobacter simplex]